MFSLTNQLTNGTIVKDTETLVAHMQAEPDAEASRIGDVGHCMCGPSRDPSLAISKWLMVL